MLPGDSAGPGTAGFGGEVSEAGRPGIAAFPVLRLALTAPLPGAVFWIT